MAQQIYTVHNGKNLLITEEVVTNVGERSIKCTLDGECRDIVLPNIPRPYHLYFCSQTWNVKGVRSMDEINPNDIFLKNVTD